MNRRSFIKDMLKVGVACTFLPGAGRIWKPVYSVPAEVVFQKDFVNAFFFQSSIYPSESILWESMEITSANPAGTHEASIRAILNPHLP